LRKPFDDAVRVEQLLPRNPVVRTRPKDRLVRSNVTARTVPLIRGVHRDRAFRTAVNRKQHLLTKMARDGLDRGKHRCVPQIIDLEHFCCDDGAAAVALAMLGVHVYAHAPSFL
jgi:hypothetical protein